MEVLQTDMSVSCHVFHPSMRNSQEHKPLILEAILGPIFTLRLILLWFGIGGCFAVGLSADAFTSNIDPSVQMCHDTRVVTDLTFE